METIILSSNEQTAHVVTIPPHRGHPTCSCPAYRQCWHIGWLKLCGFPWRPDLTNVMPAAPRWCIDAIRRKVAWVRWYRQEGAECGACAKITHFASSTPKGRPVKVPLACPECGAEELP